MKFKDRRSKKIVFVSHCLLNCNNKFPGYADVPGAYIDFIVPIIKAGIGIFQMPCLEVLGWGGVGRKKIEFELDRGNPQQEWITNYPKLCAKWAKWTADRYEDYVDNGYQILGIIHVGDSPTCGLDYVDNFPKIHFDLLDNGVSWDRLVLEELIPMLETPEQMKARGANGKGAFMSALRDELNKRGFNPVWLSYVPTLSMKDQVEEYIKVLGIEGI